MRVYGQGRGVIACGARGRATAHVGAAGRPAAPEPGAKIRRCQGAEVAQVAKLWAERGSATPLLAVVGGIGEGGGLGRAVGRRPSVASSSTDDQRMPAHIPKSDEKPEASRRTMPMGPERPIRSESAVAGALGEYWSQRHGAPSRILLRQPKP